MRVQLRTLVPSLALGALLLAAPTLAHAQPGAHDHGFGGHHGRGHHGFGGPMSGHGPHGAFEGGPMGSRMVGFMLRGLDLTDSQREQIDTLLESEQDAAKARHEALRDAHKNLHELALAETYDASAVKAAAETLGRLTAEMAENRAKIGNSIYQLLTDEQKQELAERHERMAERRQLRRGR